MIKRNIFDVLRESSLSAEQKKEVVELLLSIEENEVLNTEHNTFPPTLYAPNWYQQTRDRETIFLDNAPTLSTNTSKSSGPTNEDLGNKTFLDDEHHIFTNPKFVGSLCSAILA